MPVPGERAGPVQTTLLDFQRPARAPDAPNPPPLVAAVGVPEAQVQLQVPQGGIYAVECPRARVRLEWAARPRRTAAGWLH
eukprot:4277808-Alexandrium_andersonii.AAC.1